jgi:hypothetical protein
MTLFRHFLGLSAVIMGLALTHVAAPAALIYFFSDFVTRTITQ